MFTDTYCCRKKTIFVSKCLCFQQIGELSTCWIHWHDIGDIGVCLAAIQVSTVRVFKWSINDLCWWWIMTHRMQNAIVSTLINLIVNYLFHSLWWPCFVILFYVLSVIPTLCIKRWMQTAMFGPSYFDLSIFLTMGFVVSSFGLPIVLARAGVVCVELFRATEIFQCFNVFHFAYNFR